MLRLSTRHCTVPLATAARRVVALPSLGAALFSTKAAMPTSAGRSVLRPHHVMDYEQDHRKPRNEHGETRVRDGFADWDVLLERVWVLSSTRGTACRVPPLYCVQDEILVTDEAPGGYVVLNRARRMNALDLTTVRLLDQQIKV